VLARTPSHTDPSHAPFVTGARLHAPDWSAARPHGRATSLLVPETGLLAEPRGVGGVLVAPVHLVHAVVECVPVLVRAGPLRTPPAPNVRTVGIWALRAPTGRTCPSRIKSSVSMCHNRLKPLPDQSDSNLSSDTRRQTAPLATRSPMWGALSLYQPARFTEWPTRNPTHPSTLAAHCNLLA